jgi:hypothetical protein
MRLVVNIPKETRDASSRNPVDSSSDPVVSLDPRDRRDIVPHTVLRKRVFHDLTGPSSWPRRDRPSLNHEVGSKSLLVHCPVDLRRWRSHLVGREMDHQGMIARRRVWSMLLSGLRSDMPSLAEVLASPLVCPNGQIQVQRILSINSIGRSNKVMCTSQGSTFFLRSRSHRRRRAKDRKTS